MRKNPIQSGWLQNSGKKRAHWGLLARNDQTKTKAKYSQWVAQHPAGKAAGPELPEKK